MKEISMVATALADYITDNGTPPTVSGTYDETSLVYKSLCPKYLPKFPIKDPWGNNYVIYCGKSING
jgi:hypothetical protein